LTLASLNSSIKVNGEVTPIDPLLLFQRILVTKKSDEELEYLKNDLAPYPISIINELGMRKSRISLMYMLRVKHKIRLVFTLSE